MPHNARMDELPDPARPWRLRGSAKGGPVKPGPAAGSRLLAPSSGEGRSSRASSLGAEDVWLRLVQLTCMPSLIVVVVHVLAVIGESAKLDLSVAVRSWMAII